ncbi:MAG TPA: hypothetical protein VHY84_00280 [Bryobacteraceae bacterium]|jgi:hypothetical protein|nr:hypothetical protein [Bryobacteraceae bacterium]
MGKPDRKAKKSYTLSLETVAFLETLRKRQHAQSVSAVLEGILQTLRRDQKRASVETAVADYYSSLSDDDGAEHAHWGEFALRQFPNDEKA